MLEVTRRIERESGSVYRVNGKEVRARDVQLLLGLEEMQHAVGALVILNLFALSHFFEAAVTVCREPE